MRLIGAMQTPDGAWRVEALRLGSGFWYRVVRRVPDAAEPVVYEHLTIAGVERVLDGAGVDLGDLVPVDPDDGEPST